MSFLTNRIRAIYKQRAQPFWQARGFTLYIRNCEYFLVTPATVADMDVSESAREDGGKITCYVLICSLFAATGGLLFGYDVGISGGVTVMDEFLKKFFPAVDRKQRSASKEDNYCKYDNQMLQIFTSSLFLACLLSSFVASRICSKYGRKTTMQLASLFHLTGVVLSAASVNRTMLIFGRLLVGTGEGFTAQAVPLFISEISPPKYRGALNILFQLNITLGLLIAKIVNLFAVKLHPWGWRLSLGLAGVQAIILCLGSIYITDTPTSLIERGHVEQGIAVLQRIRGTPKVSEEYEKIVESSIAAGLVDRPYRRLIDRSRRPELVIALALVIFHQLTGINAIMFYAPMLFETLGLKSQASLLSTVIIGAVNLLATVVSIVLVDRVGRKLLLLEGCLQMFITQAAIGGILMGKLKATNALDTNTTICVILLVCLHVMGFAWSWGPLCILIPSEIFPLETRTVGLCCSINISMICTFLIAQCFFLMLCRMKAATFFFFAGWTVVMGFFVLFLLPETKGVPIDEMDKRVWNRHWFWKRFMEVKETNLETTES